MLYHEGNWRPNRLYVPLPVAVLFVVASGGVGYIWGGSPQTSSETSSQEAAQEPASIERSSNPEGQDTMKPGFEEPARGGIRLEAPSDSASLQAPEDPAPGAPVSSGGASNPEAIKESVLKDMPLSIVQATGYAEAPKKFYRAVASRIDPEEPSELAEAVREALARGCPAVDKPAPCLTQNEADRLLEHPASGGGSNRQAASRGGRGTATSNPLDLPDPSTYSSGGCSLDRKGFSAQ